MFFTNPLIFSVAWIFVFLVPKSSHALGSHVGVMPCYFIQKYAATVKTKLRYIRGANYTCLA